MKLLNKLIPVSSLASVAAIVTPLVTSCGQVSNSITYNFKLERKSVGSKPTVPFNEYITQYEPAEQLFDDGIDEDTAWQLYFDKIEKDPSVFADDFLYGASNYWLEKLDEYDLLYEGSLQVTLNSFDRENKRFSWTIEYSLNYKHEDEESIGTKYDDEIVEKIIFNDFPISLIHDRNGNWKFVPEINLDKLSEDKEYSVDVILDGLVSGKKIKSSSKINWSNCWNKFNFYYIDYYWSLTTCDLADIVDYATFAFSERPLHYLSNNLAKEA